MVAEASSSTEEVRFKSAQNCFETSLSFQSPFARWGLRKEAQGFLAQGRKMVLPPPIVDVNESPCLARLNWTCSHSYWLPRWEIFSLVHCLTAKFVRRFVAIVEFTSSLRNQIFHFQHHSRIYAKEELASASTMEQIMLVSPLAFSMQDRASS